MDNILGLSRETETIGNTCSEKEISHMQLLHVIIKVASPKSALLMSQFKDWQAGEFFLEEGHHFCSILVFN